MKGHRMSWWAKDGTGLAVPRNQTMSAGDWGWDVDCQCGWKSATGGAIQAEVKRQIQDHLWEVSA